MKYDSKLSELKADISAANSALIVLSPQPSIDELAAALSLYLSLEQSHKNVHIITEGIIKVGHTNLYGVGQIENRIPKDTGGNLTIVLSNVVDPATKKPTSLQELKWFPENSDLHLVFHPVPGQRFEPSSITPSYGSKNFDLIFVLGVSSLEDIGLLYTQNIEAFSNSKIVNIDKKSNNKQFGVMNLVDVQVSSLSEILSLSLVDLGLPYDSDIATNLLTGIFDATENLQSENTYADTYLAVSQNIKAGGKKPSLSKLGGFDLTQTQNTVNFDSLQQNQVILGQGQDIIDEEITPITVQPEVSEAVEVLQPAYNSQPIQEEQSSPEEIPSGEGSVTPESDWLTPKIYSGKSLGK